MRFLHLLNHTLYTHVCNRRSFFTQGFSFLKFLHTSSGLSSSGDVTNSKWTGECVNVTCPRYYREDLSDSSSYEPTLVGGAPSLVTEMLMAVQMS